MVGAHRGAADRRGRAVRAGHRALERARARRSSPATRRHAQAARLPRGPRAPRRARARHGRHRPRPHRPGGDGAAPPALDFLVTAVFNYPTFAESYKVAALDADNRHQGDGVARRVGRAAARGRGRSRRGGVGAPRGLAPLRRRAALRGLRGVGRGRARWPRAICGARLRARSAAAPPSANRSVRFAERLRELATGSRRSCSPAPARAAGASAGTGRRAAPGPARRRGSRRTRSRSPSPRPRR